MDTGIIKKKETIGDIVTAIVSCENGEPKQVFASLTSVISCGDFDVLDMSEIGDRVEFISFYTGSEYGEELTYINVLK